MTSGERMKRWRANPENRVKEQKRETKRRRAMGVKPAVRLTDEERTVLKRIHARQYFHRKMADPTWRENRNAYYRAQYSLRKAKGETRAGQCGMRHPRSMFDPLTCIRELNRYIRKEERQRRYEEHQSRYATETRVVRYDRDGKLTARETHVPETEGRAKRTNPHAKAQCLLNAFRNS